MIIFVVSPDVGLLSVNNESGGRLQESGDTAVMLVCSATGGFPAAVIHWEISEKIRDDFHVTRKENDGLYDVTSELRVPLMDLKSIKCIVRHPALSERMVLKASDLNLGEKGNGFFNFLAFYTLMPLFKDRI